MLNKTKEQNLKDLIGACPFCHKTKTKIVEKTDSGVPHYNGTTWTQRYKAYVTCNTCHARGPIVSKALPHPNSASNHNVNWDEVHNQKKRTYKHKLLPNGITQRTRKTPSTALKGGIILDFSRKLRFFKQFHICADRNPI